MSVCCVKSEKTTILVVFLLIVIHIHYFAEVFAKVECLIDTRMRQLTSKLQNEESLSDLLCLLSCLWVNDLLMRQWLQLNLPVEALELILFKDVFQLYKLLQFFLLFVHVFDLDIVTLKDVLDLFYRYLKDRL